MSDNNEILKDAENKDETTPNGAKKGSVLIPIKRSNRDLRKISSTSLNNKEETEEIEEAKEEVAVMNEATISAKETAYEETVEQSGEETVTDKKTKKEKRVVTARKDMTTLQWTWKEMKRNKVGYFMIAPFMIVFTMFTLFPVVLSAILSFTSFNMIEMNSDMIIWFDNYIRLFFDDDIFLKACKNTLVFAMVTGPVSYILSFLVAWFINELSPRIRAFITLVFYAPTISGSVYTIWKVIFSGDAYGWVNGKLLDLGLINEPILWFQDEKYAMGLCIVVALWMSLGTAFLSFIGGLQTMRKDVFEAASVDGIRNRWQELWYITLPMMKSYLMFGAVMSITQAFTFGAVVTELCGFPSVNYSCHTIMHCLDDYGSQRWEVGYASSIAFVLFLVMIGANMLVKKILSKVGQ